MAMFAAPGAYDRAITVFSPDGRLFQVEYALETVKRGSTVLGIATSSGVVLAAEERASSKLQDPSFMWKIFQIDDHIGAAIAGLSSDARVLIDQARVYAQSNRLMYDEPIDVAVKEILESKYKENLTMEQSVLLAIECLSKVIEGKLEAQKISAVLIPADTRKFRKLPDEEVEDYIKKGGFRRT